MLTALRMTPPFRTSAICSATSTPTASCASAVDAPRCGVSVTLGNFLSSLAAARGSSSYTSSPAAATCPLLSAATSADSLMMPPRAQLKIRTPRLHFARAASSIM